VRAGQAVLVGAEAWLGELRVLLLHQQPLSKSSGFIADTATHAQALLRAGAEQRVSAHAADKRHLHLMLWP
jgi:hypothetical protein